MKSFLVLFFKKEQLESASFEKEAKLSYHRLRRRHLIAGAALGFTIRPAQAQTRTETLRAVMGGSINSLDPVMLGSTREATGFAVNIYDTLLRFDTKPLGTGRIFDFTKITGSVAEHYEVSDDGLKITLHIRTNAAWHDGTQITADDVKWSLDRAVTNKSMAKSQVETGSITNPDQFKIIADGIVEITLPHPDRMALPNLCTPYLPMLNSRLAKQHATETDPWANDWLKTNTAAGGAYIVETFKPGEQTILRRNDTWKNGALPFFRRVIAQTVPEAATRANLVEKGDADISLDLQASDVIALEQRGKLKVIQIAQPTIMTFIALNTLMPPFDKVELRQAIAAALPYDDMFKAAVFGRGEPLSGATWTTTPATGAYPQPMPFHMDLALAKQKLAEAGYANGLQTSLTYGAGAAQIYDPIAALVKEALGKIGIELEIKKLPDAQMATMVTEKKLPMLIETSGALFPSTDYFFRVFYDGPQRWNFSGWKNAEINQLVSDARFERDPAKYQQMVTRMIALSAAEAPMVPLWKPALNAVMAPNITGFTYWYHRQLDARDLART